MSKARYKVSKVFVYDHIERDLLSPDAIVKVLKQYLILELTDEQYFELLDDADYYADGGGSLDPWYNGLVASAKAVRRQLQAQANK